MKAFRTKGADLPVKIRIHENQKEKAMRILRTAVPGLMLSLFSLVVSAQAPKNGVVAELIPVRVGIVNSSADTGFFFDRLVQNH